MEKLIDRSQAGKQLAEHLHQYHHHPDTIVLALPRGGVPVGFEIAHALSLPLDALIVRKLGVPGQEELAMGAIAMGGITVFNENILHELQISKDAIEQAIKEQTEEIERRNQRYRENRPAPSLQNKVVILVDDGIATGATMRAAIQTTRKQKPAKIVMAVPVAEFTTYEDLSTQVDDSVCLLKPRLFNAVGTWYEHFPQTTDEEVIHLLLRSLGDRG